ncbi:hydroxyacylglutathione hydrolase [soil metagenome]
MKLTALPAFSDNYIWMFHNDVEAVVIDPGQDAPVHAALDALSLQLAGILVTHHHADHVGGVDALRSRLRGPVYGPRHETIPQPCLPLVEGDEIEVLGTRFRVIDVPGHTSGHIAYFHDPHATRGSMHDRGNGFAFGFEQPVLFCGDTLFSGGCGRLFEGTPTQMHQSLSKLAALPSETRVCCAHEYTLSNLKFALAVEPDNQALIEYERQCQRQRSAGIPTLPSSIQIERQVNPFLRCDEPRVVASARQHGASSGADATEVLAALRQWKNEFR